MSFFEKLYDEHENAKVRFIGFIANDVRYDIGIVYSNMFFGKPLVICMQSNQCILLDRQDVLYPNQLKYLCKLKSDEEAMKLADYLSDLLPHPSIEESYD
ncbi:DUF3055 domain-containing protein [Bacillus sp. RG28]|uniref:DUF3055 domain-containing protein n=1 Tax=Gottfriedia endophytica TaxID=2820819 RepID=A0A940SIS3_9BACI|nr:DUF3055 domain-containing protein [Gottfriedia endophytica]MBP0724756.1 DUF3055 domain-containing protein [Gottfriedia endophytica]